MKRDRYFQVDADSPFADKLREVFAQRVKSRTALNKFLKRIKATQMYGTDAANYQFDFKSDSDADPKVWAKTKPYRNTYYFRPKKNTPEGKAMAAEIKALPAYPDPATALQTIPKLPCGFPVVIEGNTGYRPFIRFANMDKGIMIVSIPWVDVPKKELDEYIKQANSGEKRHSWCSRMDYAQWKPPSWMQELKEWEALKVIAENEK